MPCKILALTYHFLNLSLLLNPTKPYLPLICLLYNILICKNLKLSVNSVTLLTNSQVALACVFTRRVAKKNNFVSDRIRDMIGFEHQLDNVTYKFEYCYVPSNHNVSDLLTRSISVDSFLKSRSKWKKGPEWILQDKTQCLKSQLGCLPSSTTFTIINSSNVIVVNLVESSAIIEMTRFSLYEKLLGTMSKGI